MCLCTNACTCVYFVLFMYMYTQQTTPHHPLTHQIYRQWCAFARQYNGMQRAPPPHRAVRSQWPSAPLSVSPGCTCVDTCKRNTILHVPCISYVTSCETYPTTTMFPPSYHAPRCGCGGKGEGTKMMKYVHKVYIHYIVCVHVTDRRDRV